MIPSHSPFIRGSQFRVMHVRDERTSKDSIQVSLSLGNSENGHDVSYKGDHVHESIQYHVTMLLTR